MMGNLLVHANVYYKKIYKTKQEKERDTLTLDTW